MNQSACHNDTTRAIATLRLPLALMVVLIHTFVGPSDATIHWSELSAMDCFNIMRVFLSRVLPAVAVPAFFVFSGYLFFFNAERLDAAFYRRRFARRLRSLVVPFLLWVVLTAVMLVVFKHKSPQQFLTPRIFWNWASWGGGGTNLLGQTVAHNFGPLGAMLWFMRDLIIVVALSPLLGWLIGRSRGWIVALLGLVEIFEVQSVVYGQLLMALFYFSLGAWCGMFRRDLAAWLGRFTPQLLTLWVALMAVILVFRADFPARGVVYRLMCLAGTLAVIAVGPKLRMPRRLDFAARNTFFIYVAQGAFGLMAADALLAAMPPTPLWLSVRYLLQPLLTVAFCLAVLWLLQRFMPRTAALLTGSRRP